MLQLIKLVERRPRGTSRLAEKIWYLCQKNAQLALLFDDEDLFGYDIQQIETFNNQSGRT